MPAVDLANPIINSPYEAPSAYFEIGTHGPTGQLLPGRRPSESFIPVAAPTKGWKSGQMEMDFDTGERREENTLINEIRRHVEIWRASNWNGVTPYTRKLLAHWSSQPPVRDEPVFFCQREAAETAIFLAEVAGRHGTPDYRRRLELQNAMHNDALPRVGLKMATGSGKTVVMAMLIAWQTINKVMAPNDARFAKRFLVVAPGITIRDRLGVLHPGRDDNYYAERDLVPADLWGALLQAQLQVINYHVFLPRDAKEIEGVAANTRKLLQGDRPGLADAFRETPEMVASRIVRGFGSARGEIVVLNDEAHHCYQDKLLEVPDPHADKEDEDRNREARVWFTGLLHLRRRAGIKAVYDLSATPYYLKGSGYNEGFIFPWVVSDFSLMDAIESGIVKIPRTPVDDDAKSEQLVYLRLWDNIVPPLPKRRASRKEVSAASWTMPQTLDGALHSLYRSYADNHARYEAELAAAGAPPPVMIVVCPNTVVSKLVYDWIAGYEKEGPDGDPLLVPGQLPLLSNVEDRGWVTRQRTILVDSEQLDADKPLGDEFRRDAAREIETFKQVWRVRNPGGDVEKLTDADLLREAMNTIGKKGKLGEHIRCVVSVAMLTEGWDANTVTHILGIRPFRSQLLCEQVVGRGLRRRSYDVEPETGHFSPEYAEVYGVPFAFIPSDRPIPKGPQPRAPIEVYAEPSRAELAIAFPKLDGYRVELPDAELFESFDEDSQLLLDQDFVALWVRNQGIVGEAAEVELAEIREAREQHIAFAIAAKLLRDPRFFGSQDGDEKPWLYPSLVSISKRWLEQCVHPDPGVSKGLLLLEEGLAVAAQKVHASIRWSPDARSATLLPILRPFDSTGSTHEVRYVTRKATMDPPPVKSHLNHVVLDGLRGNSWEEALAQQLERDPRVSSYVKNERLGFTIPYVDSGRSHDYVPDFLVRLVTRPGDVERTLIVEVSGSRKSPGPAAVKASTARGQWCASVNAWGEMGRWGYIEVHNPTQDAALLDEAIENLYADAPIIGVPV